jgi:hypothetical protein
MYLVCDVRSLSCIVLEMYILNIGLSCAECSDSLNWDLGYAREDVSSFSGMGLVSSQRAAILFAQTGVDIYDENDAGFTN